MDLVIDNVNIAEQHSNLNEWMVRCNQTHSIKRNRKTTKLVKTMHKKDYVPINIHNEDNEKISRPPNAFMIFGKEMRKLLAQTYPQFSNKQISKLLGQQWKALPNERKTHYHGLAEEAAQMHRIKYPDYKYNANELHRQKEAKRALKKSHVKNKQNNEHKNNLTIVNDKQKINNVLSTFTHDLVDSEMSKKEEVLLNVKQNIINRFDTRKTSANNDKIFENSCANDLQFRIKKRVKEPKRTQRKSPRNKALNLVSKNNKNIINCNDERFNNISSTNISLFSFDNEMVEEIDVKPDINTLISISNEANNIDMCDKTDESDSNCTENNLNKSSFTRDSGEKCLKPTLIECGNCDQVFQQLNELMLHMSSEHNTASDNSIQCNAENIVEEPDKEKIPRPPNSFMIFGKERRKLLAQKYPQYSNKQISKLLGQQWKSLSVELKMHYNSLAEQAVQLHRIKYPDYYYSPIEARRRKANKKLLLKPRKKNNISNSGDKISRSVNHPIETKKSNATYNPKRVRNIAQQNNTRINVNEKLVIRKLSRNMKQDKKMMPKNKRNSVVTNKDEQHIKILPQAMITHRLDKHDMLNSDNTITDENNEEIFDKLNEKELNFIENISVDNRDDNAIEAMILECGNCDKVFHHLNEFMTHISNEHNTVSTDTDLQLHSIDNDEEEEKIPRPPNSFMIFGKERRKLLAQKYPQYSNKQISKILGQQWKSLTVEMKKHYHFLAQETVRVHRIKYPDYYYNPFEARRRKAEMKMMKKYRRTKHLSKKPKHSKLKSSCVQNDEHGKCTTVITSNEKNLTKRKAQRISCDLRPNRVLSHEKLNGFIHLRPKIIDVPLTRDIRSFDALKYVESNVNIATQNSDNEEIIVAQQTNEINEKNSDILGETVYIVKSEKQLKTRKSLNSLKPNRRTPQFKCVYCGKRFCSTESVQNHHRLCHNSEQQSFQCNEIHKKFSKQNT